MDMSAQMERAAEAAVAVVGGVRADQLAARTPCPEFDVRALVGHMDKWTGERAELAARKQPVEPDDGGEPDVTAEPGWPARYAAQARRAAAAWSDPAAWTGETGLSGKGAMPAGFVGAITFAEFVLHGWDLAAATGQQLELDDDVVRTLWAGLGRFADTARQMKAFGPRVPVPDSAPLLDRCLGLAGRDPAWRP